MKREFAKAKNEELGWTNCDLVKFCRQCRSPCKFASEFTTTWAPEFTMAPRFDWGKHRLPKDQALARPDVPHFAPLEGWRHRVFGQLSCKCTDQNSGLLPTSFFVFFISCGCRFYDSCVGTSLVQHSALPMEQKWYSLDRALAHSSPNEIMRKLETHL